LERPAEREAGLWTLAMRRMLAEQIPRVNAGRKQQICGRTFHPQECAESRVIFTRYLRVPPRKITAIRKAILAETSSAVFIWRHSGVRTLACPYGVCYKTLAEIELTTSAFH
jgi:hypothetical protein